jgi:hypothetical protein
MGIRLKHFFALPLFAVAALLSISGGTQAKMAWGSSHWTKSATSAHEKMTRPLFASSGAACPSLPYILVNGATADANQVMANFNSLLGCINNPPVTTIAPLTVLGNATGSTAAPAALTTQQLTGLCDLFTSALQGCVPASGGGTANFLRADGTWASPGGQGNISGPGGSTNGYVPQWSGTAGTALSAGLPVGTSGNNTILETGAGGAISSQVLPPPGPAALGGVESATAPANQAMTGINTAGVPQFAQFGFSNLSGSAALTQLPQISSFTMLGNETSTTGAPSAIPLAWNVIAPTGTSSDQTTLQNAVNGALPVFMKAGIWDICSQITVPPSQIIRGAYTDTNPGSQALPNPGAAPPPVGFSKTYVDCYPDTPSFTSGQAFFALQDHDVLEGISIYGMEYTHANSGVNCVNLLNTVSVTLAHDDFALCHEGVYNYSNGTSPGYAVCYSQLTHIHDSLFYKNDDYGYYAGATNINGTCPNGSGNGGFVSDLTIGPNNDFGANFSGQIYIGGCSGGSSAVDENRIEDNQNGYAGIGVTLTTTSGCAGQIQFTGNNFDRVQAFLISSANNVSITGGRMSCCLYGTYPLIEFSGTNGNIDIAGVEMEPATNIPVFKVDSSAVIQSGQITENLPAPQYYDNYTQSVIQPLLTTTQTTVKSLLPQNIIPVYLSPVHITETNVTDGFGGTTATQIVEDTTANYHEISNYSGPTVGNMPYIFSAIIAPVTGTGTSAREADFIWTDSSDTNYMTVAFNPTTCAYVSGDSSVGGAAAILSTATTALPNGFCAVSAKLSLGGGYTNGSVTDYVLGDLYPGGFRSFTGDGKSGVIFENWSLTPAVQASAQPPLSGTTGSIGGSALGVGACTTGTASISGATTSMAAWASPVADPGTGFTWNAFVSAAGTATVRLCNVSGASATPTAEAYNVRVIQ